MNLEVSTIKQRPEDEFAHVDTFHPHHKKMISMHRMDTWGLLAWIAAVWLILAGVFYSITQVAHDYSMWLALGIGVILCIFTSAALLACNTHLTTNKRGLYLQDIKHQRESSGLMKFFDIFFILVLCYISLLLPIILRGTVLVGSGESNGMDYAVNPPLLAAVLVSTVSYLVYILRRSDREMRKMYNIVYGPKEEKQ